MLPTHARLPSRHTSRYRVCHIILILILGITSLLCLYNVVTIHERHDHKAQALCSQSPALVPSRSNGNASLERLLNELVVDAVGRFAGSLRIRTISFDPLTEEKGLTVVAPDQDEGFDALKQYFKSMFPLM